MTGLCQRPIVHNRTRPVVPGAYWTVTGQCLRRVRSCDHHVWSSRKKRISPFLTVRSDLVLLSKKFFTVPNSRRRCRSLAQPPPSHRPRPRLSTAAPRHARARAFLARARAVPPRCAPATASSPFRRRSRAAAPPRRSTTCPRSTARAPS
jgi:hypothetical protein